MTSVGSPRLFVQSAVVARSFEIVPTDFPHFASPSVEALLHDMPTAHPAPLIGRRGMALVGQTAGAVALHARGSRRARIRFVYFLTDDASGKRELYHHHLVMAEVLLDRVFAAHAHGMYPIMPTLTRAVEARAMHRPPRQLLRAGTLEYRRWYDSHGKPREQPLTLETLAAWLVKTEGVSMPEARARAAHRSFALSDLEQHRLLERRHAATESRPLDQAEFRLLVEALDGACRVPSGAPKIERANREIARRAAALLGDLLNDFVASPFVTPELDHAFGTFHVEALRRSIESSRESESLRVGPRAWFAAKAERMRAEHQVGLALTPAVTDARARFRVAALRVRAAVNRSLQYVCAG